jgi:hypothetical protein
MCEMCDGKSAAQMERDLRRSIRRHGWALQYVQSGIDEYDVYPAYCYSVGHTAKGLPELVVTGRVADQSAQVLNDLGSWQASGLDLRPGDRHTAGGLDVYLVEVRECESWLLGAVAMYGRIRALQAVWADCRGLLPWEGAEDWTIVQPLLGPPRNGTGAP